MKKSNYYDYTAQRYDQIRWLTESVAEEVADFILKLSATPETCFLEPGVGTGLNIIPRLRRLSKLVLWLHQYLSEAVLSFFTAKYI
ncbi:MAG: hypothetical protein RMY16_02920 [Nostoc sp. DedQUE12b]|uniref:hypothetical protein n=1 Tax=Nostoc sp. DedQUE12b TaxID=3075398 RepID=UPI002AD3E10D|nr:hypothetical protein [Nostoc sp. DedQUE12b]MDZ8084536.1 hypothetical protein [Nostoc sp. DedQUE12b]